MSEWPIVGACSNCGLGFVGINVENAAKGFDCIRCGAFGTAVVFDEPIPARGPNPTLREARRMGRQWSGYDYRDAIAEQEARHAVAPPTTQGEPR